MSRLGLVTIGQSPRTDVTEDLADLLVDVDWIEHGALDPVPDDELPAYGPRPDEVPLVSRLRDGSPVTIGHEAVLPLLEEAFERCVADGASTVLLMCTGHFDGLTCSVPLYQAEPLAQEYVASIAQGHTLGVVNPLTDQSEDAAERWSAAIGAPVVMSNADPYTDSLDTIVEAGRSVAAQGADLIALDCFGYSTTMGRAVSGATRTQVVVTREAAVEQAIGRRFEIKQGHSAI